MDQQETLDDSIDGAFAELGLTSAATAQEIKSAWRRMVSKWHPDRNDSATAVAKMQRINRAVEAIRQAGFDRPGPFASAGGAAPDRPHEPHRPGKPAPSGADFDDAEPAGSDEPDGHETQGRTTDGKPVRTINRRVRLTLEEAAFGCTKDLRGKVTQACTPCGGAGYRMLDGHCPQCKGSGAVSQRSWFGWPGTQVECDTCRGSGAARQPCSACAGGGKAESQRYKITVRIPHGVRDGDLLSVNGRQGKPGFLPGDLNIHVEVSEHALLKLDKDGTVLCNMPVDGFAWITNRTVDVPTLSGVQTIQLQREQRSYRLKKQGFPVERRGARADQLIVISPVFPQTMTTDQQILIDQLIATTSGPDAKPWDEQLQRWNQDMQAWKRRGGACN